MKAILVNLDVKKEYIEQFKEVTFYNSENARKEPGNLRFDVLQDADTPNLFYLYEVYKSDEAIAYHKTTEHYNKWVSAADEMLVKPRSRVFGVPLCPADEEAYES